MCAKQLYVKSNGTWVAAGGAGGSVDTAGLATEQFVTDAIGAGGFATLTDLNDALANIPEPAITLHGGAIPEPTTDTPQGLEDAFAGLDDGLHYYTDVGSLVAITRQQYQTTITLTGQLSSFAKVVKSESGLSTPENPSLIVMQTAEGQWLKLTSDALDEPFGKPQQVDIFALTGGTVDLSGYYTKPEVDAKVSVLQQGVDDANLGVQGVADQIPFVAEQIGIQTEAKLALKADKADTYTKKEVDDQLESDKDFSIANDNVLLASITSLQEIVSNLGTGIGTGQIDVLDAIRDVEIEPAMITLSGDAASPIAWKGGLSLVPVKEGADWKLGWNNSKSVSNLATQEDLSGYAPISTTTLITTQLQAVFDSIYTRAESDDRYAKRADNTQSLLAKVVTAQGYGFGDKNEPPVALTYTDTGEGYNERLVLATASSIDYVVMKSDLDELQGLLPRMERLEGKAAPVVDLSPYVTLVDADAKYGTKEALDLLRSQTQIIFDSVYTRVEADVRYAAKADVYTQKQTEDRFMRIEQAFSKADFDNQMALFLYSRKQVDDKLAAISPIASPSINDPALAEFKKSVLDEVKLMMAGGTKQPPPDIDWTWMVRMDGAKESISTEIQARMIGGFIELKGTLAFNAGSGAWVPLRLPPQFPLAELEASYPLAMRLVGSAVTYGYCTVSKTNRDISVSPGARSSEAGFSGIRWKAAY